MSFRILREAEEEALAALTSGAETVFFVLQRSSEHWSPGARIIRVFANRSVAELFAASQKAQHLQSFFAVAELISEARQVANPVEIVRLGGTDGSDA